MIQIVKKPNGVTLEVTDWDDLDYIGEHNEGSDVAFLHEALDVARYIGNGWSVRDADSMGMMSSSTCLLYGEELDDNGRYVSAEHCYYVSDYRILSVYQTLLEEGEVFLEKLW